MLYILALLSAFLNWVAQILWKIWLDKFDFKSSFFTIILNLIKNLYFLSGCFLYFLSIIVWFFVISKLDVSKAYPFLALSYIIIIIWWYLIWESVNVYKLLWIAFIIIGIIFISKS